MEEQTKLLGLRGIALRIWHWCGKGSFYVTSERIKSEVVKTLGLHTIFTWMLRVASIVISHMETTNTPFSKSVNCRTCSHVYVALKRAVSIANGTEWMPVRITNWKKPAWQVRPWTVPAAAWHSGDIHDCYVLVRRKLIWVYKRGFSRVKPVWYCEEG